MLSPISHSSIVAVEFKQKMSQNILKEELQKKCEVILPVLFWCAFFNPV